MSRSPKDVKNVQKCQWYLMCQKSNTLTMHEAHKNFNLTEWGCIIIQSILRWHMRIIKIAQKHIIWTFWRFSVTTICEVKIDLTMCEPHDVKLNFYEPHLQSRYLNFWQLTSFQWRWGEGSCDGQGVMQQSDGPKVEGVWQGWWGLGWWNKGWWVKDEG